MKKIVLCIVLGVIVAALMIASDSNKEMETFMKENNKRWLKEDSDPDDDPDYDI